MNILRNIVVASLLASPALLHAQGESEVMSVKVPFPFTAQGIAMPAGRYTLSYTARTHRWALRTYGHYALEVRVAGEQLGERSPLSSLIFDRRADSYSLREIRQSGDAEAFHLLPSTAEKKSTPREAEMQPVSTETIVQSAAHDSRPVK